MASSFVTAGAVARADNIEPSAVQETLETISEIPEVQEAPETIPEISEVPEIQETVPEISEVPEVQETVPEIPEALEAVPEIPEVPEVQETVPEIPEVPEVQETIPEISEVPETQETIPEISEVTEVQETVPEISEVPEVQETVPEIPEALEAVPEAPEVPEAQETVAKIPEVSVEDLWKDDDSEGRDPDNDAGARRIAFVSSIKSFASVDGVLLQSTDEDSSSVPAGSGGEGNSGPSDEGLGPGGEGHGPGGEGHGPGGEGHGPRPQGNSEIKDTNTDAPQIVEHPAVQAYALLGSSTEEIPKYTCSATLPEGTTEGTITFTWYVDGTPVYTSSRNAVEGDAVTSTYQADTLKNLTEYGVHPVYCVVSMETTNADENGNEIASTVSNQSMSVNYILCNGVNTNSLLTFSDVHESFSNIGSAIGNIMSADGEGLIPALIVCTGDWKNSVRWMGGEKTSDNYIKTRDILISRLLGQSGGIDTVFVSGNHENGAAARDANIEADLGVTAEYDGAGVIFDSAAANTDGKSGSSSALRDLVVYGINYENLKTDEGMSYENVLDGLEQYLEGLRENYAGQLIVISAHAGLHVVDGWGGKEEYNIDKSNEMVALLNHYSELGMNITFLFGHDHSRRESEMLLTPGDTITSTVRYTLKDTDEDSAKESQVIKFTYGHAGYITNNIGGNQRYTVINWTDLRMPEATVSRTLYQLDQEGNATPLEDLSADTKTVTAYHLTDQQEEYTWARDDETGFTVHTDGDLETVFTGVMVDGKVMSAENYTTEGGAATVTLNPRYLKTLEKGIHTIKILFANDTEDRSNVEAAFHITGNSGSASADEVSPAQQDQSAPGDSGSNSTTGTSLSYSGVYSRTAGSPKTGDESCLCFWTLVDLLAFCGLTAALNKLKKNGKPVH